MTVREVVQKLGLELLAPPGNLEAEVRGGYASDLPSDVMANAQPGQLWLTLQTHPNVAAVAALKELAAVILVNGRKPDPTTLEKAEEHKLTLLGTDLPSFELAGRLYALGVKGGRP